MTSTGFGWVKYNDKIYQYDIMITVSGEVIPRNDEEIKRKYGTPHAIDASEINFLLQQKPRAIVIGTGQVGMARLTKDANTAILKSTARIIEGASPAACKKFDALTGPKAAIIHVTC